MKWLWVTVLIKTAVILSSDRGKKCWKSFGRMSTILYQGLQYFHIYGYLTALSCVRSKWTSCQNKSLWLSESNLWLLSNTINTAILLNPRIHFIEWEGWFCAILYLLCILLIVPAGCQGNFRWVWGSFDYSFESHLKKRWYKYLLLKVIRSSMLVWAIHSHCTWCQSSTLTQVSQVFQICGLSLLGIFFNFHFIILVQVEFSLRWCWENHPLSFYQTPTSYWASPWSGTWCSTQGSPSCSPSELSC